MASPGDAVHHLSAFGLLLAGTMSVATVFMEVARKKAVAGRPLMPVLFWAHVFDTILFIAAWLFYRSLGNTFYIRPGGDLFGQTWVQVSPAVTYVIYQFIDQAIHALANWLFFKALQEAAMSTAVPFLAFTSVMIIPTGFLLLGEMPGPVKLLGVVLATVGSVAMHWRLFALGWTRPFKAIYEDKGSRYMLYVSMLLAVLTPLDKKLAMMTDTYTQTVIYGAGMAATFFLMAWAAKEPLWPVLKSRNGLRWIALAGLIDAGALLLQFESYRYIDAVIVISIKRSGIILAVWFGWLFFRERNIGDKLMAATVMFVGVMILYLPLSMLQAVVISAVTIAAMMVYMKVTLVRPA